MNQSGLGSNSPDLKNRKLALKEKKKFDKENNGKRYERVKIMNGFILKEVKA